MKITIQNNRIGCTQDNYNHLFWSSVEIDCFHYDPHIAEYLGQRKDFYEAYTANADYAFDEDLQDDLAAAHNDIGVLSKIISKAKFYGVGVDEAVKSRLEELKIIYARLANEYTEQIKQAEVKRTKIKHWQFLQKHGCKGCGNLRYDTDMPWCKVLHEQLQEKSCPDYDNELVFHFVNWLPFPSDNCPFKVDTKENKDE